jgi:serine protease Do
MVGKAYWRSMVLITVAIGGGASLALAQNASTNEPPKKVMRPATPVAENKVAPQVVTIIHRLNGLKMFRLLLRSEGQPQAIDTLDEAFNLMDDVHTNVIAGLAMEDGRTIAARLPEVEAEFGPPLMPGSATASPSAPVAAFPAPSDPAAIWAQGTRKFFVETPDLTVVSADGKRLAVRYVGLDGVTGLSILQLASGNLNSAVTTDTEVTSVGQNIKLLGPEPVASARPLLSGNLYVRVGETPAKILNVMRSPSGSIARFKVRSPRLLSPANVGGVAINEAGETVGIVDTISGVEARILPTALIRLAAKRVLTHQASVPRPWLGVKGEPVAALNVEEIERHGWQSLQATTLAEDHRGILLTGIVPSSPASLAGLKTGDVILTANDLELQSVEDFSWVLGQAGASNTVRFKVARPDSITPTAVNVKLSESLDPGVTFSLLDRASNAQGPSLIDQGLEVIALKPAVAARLGADAGLLIVYVEPATAAFEAGLQPGDVIQSIDGKPVTLLAQTLDLSHTPGAASTFEIVRRKQKLTVKVVHRPTKNN